MKNLNRKVKNYNDNREKSRAGYLKFFTEKIEINLRISPKRDLFVFMLFSLK